MMRRFTRIGLMEFRLNDSIVSSKNNLSLDFPFFQIRLSDEVSSSLAREKWKALGMTLSGRASLYFALWSEKPRLQEILGRSLCLGLLSYH